MDKETLIKQETRRIKKLLTNYDAVAIERRYQKKMAYLREKRENKLS